MVGAKSFILRAKKTLKKWHQRRFLNCTIKINIGVKEESMSRENSSVDWENDIYSKGKQLNLWPFSEVVSVFNNEMAAWSRARAPRVLEVGCGAGNNLWALGTLGFEAYGTDISPSAISFGEKRFSQLGMRVKLLEANMLELPFEDSFFDFVLDRAALSQVSMDEIPDCLGEIQRVLTDKGKLYCFGLFGDRHSGRFLGELQTNGSYDNFSGGVFAKVGLTSFFNRDSIAKIFNVFSDLEISRKTIESSSHEFFEEYFLVAKGKKFNL